MKSTNRKFANNIELNRSKLKYFLIFPTTELSSIITKPVSHSYIPSNIDINSVNRHNIKHKIQDAEQFVKDLSLFGRSLNIRLLRFMFSLQDFSESVCHWFLPRVWESDGPKIPWLALCQAGLELSLLVWWLIRHTKLALNKIIAAYRGNRALAFCFILLQLFPSIYWVSFLTLCTYTRAQI